MMNAPVQADLRHLLSLRPGQTAVNWGFGSPLEDSLRAEGIRLLSESAVTLPPETLSLGLMVLTDPASASFHTLAALRRALRPGATLLLGLKNPFSWQRFLRGTPGPWFVAHLPALLRRLGVDELQTFGVYDSLQEPRAIVPLDEPRFAAFFFEMAFTPYTRRARWLARLSPWLCRLGLQQTLFPALCIRGKVAPLRS